MRTIYFLILCTSLGASLGCEQGIIRAAAAKPAARPAKKKPAPAAAAASSLLDPSKFTATAPAAFTAKFATSKGEFRVEVKRELSPLGADRFYNLVKNGYFDGVRFFRAIQGFMVQFGIHGDPKVNAAWRTANIKDDPVKGSNKRGTITFAKTGMPNSRTTQMFISYSDNVRLDGMGFASFGHVSAGMNVVDSLYTGYGEGAPSGMGPEQGRVQGEGNAYLEKDFPKLDYIKKAEIVVP
jgi:peptidyl-prolyl cis-trans isomerase A (cyclophilin A)